MKKTKKIAIFVLTILVVTGGAYIFRDSALFDGLSSSVLDTSFVCTDSTLQSQASSYRKTTIRYKKALVLQKNLESDIAQAIATMSGEVQKKQDALKILKRQIGVYLRFIKKYDTCRREVDLEPSISLGLMSGEARVIVSLPDTYQELAGFEISSPEGLNTFLNVLQFQVRITPATSLAVDQWFLVHDASAASPCQSSQSGETLTIECDMLGGIPESIPSGTKNAYRLGAHITSVDQAAAGSIEIEISGLIFNDGREDFLSNTTLSILQYGILPALPEIARAEATPVDTVVALSPELDQATIPPVVVTDSAPASEAVPPPTEPLGSDAPSSGDSTGTDTAGTDTAGAIIPGESDMLPPVDTSASASEEPSSDTTTPPPPSSDTDSSITESSTEETHPASESTAPATDAPVE